MSDKLNIANEMRCFDSKDPATNALTNISLTLTNIQSYNGCVLQVLARAWVILDISGLRQRKKKKETT